MPKSRPLRFIEPRKDGHDPPGYGLDVLPTTRGRIQLVFGLLTVVLLFLCVLSGRLEPGGPGRQLPSFLHPLKTPSKVGYCIAVLSALVVMITARYRDPLTSIRCALYAQVSIAVGVSLITRPFLGGIPVAWGSCFIVLFPLFVPADRRQIVWSSGLAALATILTPIPHLFGLSEGPGARGGANVWDWVALVATTSAAWGIAVAISRLQRTVIELARRLRTLGDFVLVKKLGEGGFGEVWLAEQPLLGTNVAVKLIRPARLAEAKVERQFLDGFAIRKEAFLMATLECPHVAKVTSLGVSEDGEIFIVMEYLQGKTLEASTTSVPFDLGRVGRIGLAVCWALEESHALGVIHGDLKPRNIMLCRYAAREEFVKVLDFGMGYLLGSRIMRKLIDARHRLSTLAYNAPELFDGAEPSVETDVYALGCVLYELLTAHKPFLAITEEEIRKQHTNPNRPRVGDYRTDSSNVLSGVVDACLSIDPTKRPTLAEVTSALQDLTTG